MTGTPEGAALRKARKAADDLTAAVLIRVDAKDRSEVECPRERSFMTPCVARDGGLAVADDGVCVGCGISPASELERIRSNP